MGKAGSLLGDLDPYAKELKIGAATIRYGSDIHSVLIWKNEGGIAALVSNHRIDGDAVVCLRPERHDRSAVGRRFLQ